jgi:3-dehydroquinate synthase
MQPARTVEVVAPSGRSRIEFGCGLRRHVGERMAAAGLAASAGARVALVRDAGVPEACVAQVRGGIAVPVVDIAVAGGEAAKSLETVADVAARMLDGGIDRGGAVVALGGGAVGDLAGFVAAAYMRGIPCVQVPTTLLAMVDASVGGKSAVNLLRGDGTLAKNMLGAIVQPPLVVVDPECLATLPPRELRSGLAECIKHAIIADEAMLGWIAARADAIRAADPSTLLELVDRNVRIKAAVVAGDEREDGPRAALNLGHTFAHAIESSMHAACTHGEAVAIGLVAASRLAAALGAPAAGALEERVRSTLGAVGLPTGLPAPRPASVMRAAMASDKKRRGGALRLVVPFAAGDVRTGIAATDEAVDASWRAVGAT